MDTLAWQGLEADLNTRGYALTPRLLSEAEYLELSVLYERDALFRKTIDMTRLSFGEGEYRYFAEPLPEHRCTLGITIHDAR